MIPTRIALISEHASPLAQSGSVDCGGQNVYVAHVARQLAARGWLVDVFSRRDSAAQPEVIEWLPGVRVVNVPAGPARCIPKEELLPYVDDFADWMQYFMRRQALSYDVIHANFFMSAWIGLQLRRAFGIPLVVTFHALGRVRREHQREADRFPDSRFAMEQAAMDEADAIVAECPEDLADMRRLYGVDPWRVHVVPCGFDSHEFRPLSRRHSRMLLDMPAGEFSVLQLGRMVPRKGVDTVVESIAALRDRHNIRAALYVVGGNTHEPDPVATPEIARLSQIAHDLGIRHQVHFVGQRDRDELAHYYCATNVFVTTPWYEPFGITPVEAMACSRPVIGAEVGGIGFSVVDGETGFLVPPRDPLAVAHCLARLYHDPALAGSMGLAGHARAEACFTWAKVADELIAVYTAVAQSADAGAFDEQAPVDTLVAPSSAPMSMGI
ncbi:glycosyltransferase family 4 protein [Uliginosibacterium sp. sgz301328]|uniref:glycosyltransferase family 4 protein n=1 Tax=Uliginosibacterium sp. sgz301328 TaxID=3243764 RepID=UPI00359D0FE8